MKLIVNPGADIVASEKEEIRKVLEVAFIYFEAPPLLKFQSSSMLTSASNISSCKLVDHYPNLHSGSPAGSLLHVTNYLVERSWGMEQVERCREIFNNFCCVTVLFLMQRKSRGHSVIHFPKALSR